MTPIDKLLADLKEPIGDKNILNWSQFIAHRNRRAFRVEHPGTLFKLYLLYRYLNFPYIPIIHKQRSIYTTRKIIYLDAFCGNGLNSLRSKGSEIFVCGSSILAILAWYRFNPNLNFDQMVLIDKEMGNVSLLKQRITSIADELGFVKKIFDRF